MHERPHFQIFIVQLRPQWGSLAQLFIRKKKNFLEVLETAFLALCLQPPSFLIL